MGVNRVATEARLNVQAGGVFTSASEVETEGLIDLTGGTVNLNGGLDVSVLGQVQRTGGVLNFAAGSTVTVRNGGGFTSSIGFVGSANGTVTVTGSSSELTVSGGGLSITGGTQVNVTQGGTVTSTGTTTATVIGTTGPGAVTVDGNLSHFHGNATSIGGGGNTGTLTLQNGGSAAFPALDVAVSGTTGSVGTVLAQSGGDLSMAGDLRVQTQAGGNPVGTLTVTGTGSSFSQALGGPRITVGTTGGSGTGTINVASGGSFVTGDGPTTVNATGRIFVNGGSFAARGDVTVNGGLIDATGGFSVGGGNTLAVTNGGTANIGSIFSLNGAHLVVGGTGSHFNGSRVIVSNGGTITVNVGGLAAASSELILSPGGAVTMNGGTLQVSGVTPEGGSVAWNAGTVQFTAPGTTVLDAAKLTTLLGPGSVLSAGRALVVDGTASVAGPMAVWGGTLTVGDLSGGSLVALEAGTLNLSAANLTVGTAGQLGNQVNLPFGMNVNVTGGNSTTVNAGGLLRSEGGTFSSANGITNNGTIQLAGDLARVGGGALTNAGIVRGTGSVANNLTNAAAGQVQVTAGDRLEFQGTANANSGSISVTGGEAVFTGPLTNAAGTGLVSGRDGVLRTGGLSNNGSLAFSNGTMDVFGDVTSTRFVTASDRSRITVSGGGTVNFYDDVTVAPGQTDVQISAVGGTVSKVVFFGGYNGGTTGGGSAFIEGDLRPGNSPALVRFDGDVGFGNGGRFLVELGGPTIALQYDSADVAGTASLAGVLDVDLIDGFQPQAGQQFTVLTFGSRVGDFAAYRDLNLGNGLGFVPAYSDHALTLTVTPVPEPGTMALGGLAAAWVALRRRRKNVE